MSLGILAALLAAALVSLFMAWVLGAGGSSTPFAPAVGANAVSVMRAALIVGALAFLGAVTQGGSVSQTIGGGLVDGVTMTPAVAVVGLLTAGGLMAFGVYTGYPIATAFTVTGAMIGAGLALGGAPAWGTYEQIATLWLLAPLVVGGGAFASASVLPREDVPERASLAVLAAVVGAIVANVRFHLLSGGSGAASPARIVGAALGVSPLVVTLAAALLLGGAVYRDVARDDEAGVRHFLLLLGALVAFSAGASQVGLAVGPLLPLLSPFAVPAVLVLMVGGLGMLLGAWTGAPRMLKSLSRDYSALGPRRAVSALVPSFAVAQVAVLFGLPISFNEIIVSAIVGSGLAVVGRDGVSSRKLARTIGAWIGSFVLSLAVGYGVFHVVS